MYIIGGVVVLLILGWFLMGGLGANMAGVDVDRNLDGSATYSNEEGSVTVGGGMPQNWPSDVPGVYSGAAIQYSGTSNPQTGEAGSAVVYTARASAQAVVDYYRQGLTSAGWTIEGTATIGAATVLTARKDTRTVGIHIADTGDGNVAVTAGVEL